MIVTIEDSAPRVAPDAWVHSSAYVIGDVELGAQASVWFHSVVRGDVNRVRIGSRTNVQDLSVIHVTHEDWPTIIGDRVTIGHRAMLHGCTIADDVLIGIGAILLDGVEIGTESLVGAGSLVVPRTKVPPRSLVLGSPAKVVRELRADEIEHIHESADNYVRYSERYRKAGIV